VQFVKTQTIIVIWYWFCVTEMSAEVVGVVRDSVVSRPNYCRITRTTRAEPQKANCRDETLSQLGVDITSQRKGSGD